MFDPVQAPPLGHAFELVNAAILKADSRLQHQILQRAADVQCAHQSWRSSRRSRPASALARSGDVSPTESLSFGENYLG